MGQVCCDEDGRGEFAVFDPEYPMVVLGFEQPVIAMDLREQDFVRPDRQGGWFDGEWLVIEGKHSAVAGENIHLLLRAADAGEVSWERREAARERLSEEAAERG